MDIIKLKEYLSSLNSLSFSDLNEYQNKYYLKKQIQVQFPEIKDDIIYKAIEATNHKLKETILTKRYSQQLSGEIIYYLNNKVDENNSD